MKNSFTQYTEKLESKVSIKEAHKQKLAEKLFESEKKPFWTWTKAIFTAPVVASLILIFFLSSNQETVKQVLSPQEALAQALENTFNLSAFQNTLGLPNDGKLYHRTVTYENNYIIEGSGSFIETANLWTDGIKLRKDNLILSETLFNGSYKNFTSFLKDPEMGKNCYYFQNTPHIVCESISKFNEGFLTNFIANNEMYKPVESENLISDLTVTSHYEGFHGPQYILKWSTKDPMESALLPNGYSVYGSGLEYLQNPSELPYSDPDNYVNVLNEGKYWHRISIAMDMTFMADKTYFQFRNHDPDYPTEFLLQNSDSDNTKEHLQAKISSKQNTEYSMIYVIDRNSGELTSLNPKQFIEAIKKQSASNLNANNDLYDVYRGLQSLVFLLKKDKFSQPISVQIVEKNAQKVFQVRYEIPKAFWIDEKNILEQDFVDFYLDEKQVQFLGYEISKKDGTKLESTWIKDEVMADTEKNKVFEPKSWEKSIPKEYKPEEIEWREY